LDQDSFISRRKLLAGTVACAAIGKDLFAAATPGIDIQPFFAQVQRVVEALDTLGSPLKPADRDAISKLLSNPNSKTAVADITHILEPYVILNVVVNPESRVSVVKNHSTPRLVQHGWKVFLIRVENLAEATGKLRCVSEQALPVSGQAPGSQITATGIVPPGSSRPVSVITEAQIVDRWLALEMFDKPPLLPELSGLNIEYRIIQLYSRDEGQREATIGFDVGPATADIGYRNSTAVLFQCDPACALQLKIRESDGSPAVAALTIRDEQGRIYPCCAKRLAPDFPFQKQIYRADGSSVVVPPGKYLIEFDRGPEYITQKREIVVGSRDQRFLELQLKRWINPVEHGWYPGDHHVHAAGCSHYNTPTEGVRPADMAPQVRGEGLSFADILTWGPCWYHQKEFFRGSIDPVSTAKSVLRYDVEISGFPSSYWGHLVLLQLQGQDFPGTKRIEDWPTWNLPILRWAKKQGAVAGFAHIGHGLTVSSNKVPNLLIPEFNDNGANEFLIDLAHGAVDFLSACDTPAPAELNLWYHTLNCGFNTPVAGETDFPCLFEKVGVGRSYVYLPEPPIGDAGYRAWIAGLRAGRSYVSDGRSHVLSLEVNGRKLSDGNHHLQLTGAGTLSLRACVAAYLPERPTKVEQGIRAKEPDDSPFWHIERCRIGDSRQVSAEIILNGEPIASRKINADGKPVWFETEVGVKQSSWLAIRVLPSSHSNPISISVGNKPLRASRDSAQWCIDCIEAAWKRLGPRITPASQAEARSAKDHAVAVFQKIRSDAAAA
jgi:hypothetical protein